MKFLACNLNNFIIFDDVSNTKELDKITNLSKYKSQDTIILCNSSIFMELSQSSNFMIADIIELFVFLYPNASCSSNIFSIYKYLTGKIVEKATNPNLAMEQEVELLKLSVQVMLDDLHSLSDKEKNSVYELAFLMQKDNWYFSQIICQDMPTSLSKSKNFIQIWNHLKDFKDDINFDCINNEEEFKNISTEDVEAQYESIVANYNRQRLSQKDYAKSVGEIFSHNYTLDNTQQFIFAEAGTGIGKTIGYLSGVFAFLRQNPHKQVLISTYSKALQKQVLSQVEKIIEQNMSKLNYCLAKGSNNYICLLNYETLLNNVSLLPRGQIFLAMIARWLLNNKGGDLIGGDLNPLIFEIFNDNYISFVLNKKDECIYSKCKFFKKCFAIKSKFQAKNSNIVVANHAYSILNNGIDSSYVIFDEAHHLFNSADDIFAYDLGINSLASLKNYICGGKGRLQQSKYVLNGLKAKLNFSFTLNEKMDEEEKLLSIAIENTIDALIDLCEMLPQKNTIEQIASNFVSNSSSVLDKFFMEIYNHVQDNDVEKNNNYYSQEIEVNFLQLQSNNNFEVVLNQVIKAFNSLLKISTNLYGMLNAKLVYLEGEDKKALSDLISLFEARVVGNLVDFINMLDEIKNPDKNFIYRFSILKEEGRIFDIAYLKNYINPMQPFAHNVLNHMQGVVFTSATLKDSVLNEESKTNDIQKNYGLNYLENPYKSKEVNFLSPFNYAQNSKVLIINNNDQQSLSKSIEEIFYSCGGGALAIFTAISRLKQVYKDIRSPLLNSGIKVIAQHINQQKLVNLIDIFKDDINSCLLGTDSARDGIDIPGQSLKLVLFEKIPWAKPDILLKHRVKALGNYYVDELVRYKLRQAFGRLIRKEDDRGIFVILSSAFPSKFLNAFPLDVEVKRVSFEVAIKEIKKFY